MGVQVAWLALALLSTSPAVTESPSPPANQPAWSDSGKEATAVRAAIAVSKNAGTLTRTEVRDYGEDGINLVAQYSTPDEQIFGTIFIYRPTLVDSGLTFLATDEAIRRRLGASGAVVDDRKVAVDGVAHAGRRVIYSSSEGGMRHSALTIVQAGNWMMKYRVSGPTSRADEIASNLDALVRGTRFGKGSEPLPTHVIQVTPCLGVPSTGDAKVVRPEGSSAMGLALLAIPRFNDDKGKAVADPTGRVPDRLCLVESATDEKIPLLTYRAVEPRYGLFAPTMFQLYGDAGIIVEVTRPVKSPNELFALRHGLGRTIIYGAFSAEPSSGQLQMIRHQSDQLLVVAAISDKPSGNGSDIQLNCNTFAEGCSEKR